jgi:hypothetical protein
MKQTDPSRREITMGENTSPNRKAGIVRERYSILRRIAINRNILRLLASSAFE